MPGGGVKEGDSRGLGMLTTPPSLLSAPQALERDLRAFLGELGGPQPQVQVNEVTGSLRVKGYWERELREWLLRGGF